MVGLRVRPVCFRAYFACQRHFFPRVLFCRIPIRRMSNISRELVLQEKASTLLEPAWGWNTSSAGKEEAGYADIQVSSAESGHNHVDDLRNSQPSDTAVAREEVGVRAVSTECAAPAPFHGLSPTSAYTQLFPPLSVNTIHFPTMNLTLPSERPHDSLILLAPPAPRRPCHRYCEPLLSCHARAQGQMARASCA